MKQLIRKHLFASFTFIVFVIFFLYSEKSQENRISNVDTERVSTLREEERKLIHNLVSIDGIDELHDATSNCNLAYVNAKKLQQDHPCVLQIIRQHFIKAPPGPGVPLNLKYSGYEDLSAGQTTAVRRLLNNQTGGFYVECGAAGGEILSTTLPLERHLNWTGLLIEADPVGFKALTHTNRNSWKLPLCLSTENYPMKVTFESAGFMGKIGDGKEKKNTNKTLVEAQCFPLYSVLLAHGRTSIDYLSLDVEGHELKILKTVPWDKVDIKIITVEWEWIPEGKQALIDFMTSNGFVNFGDISTSYALDTVFVKDFLRDLRTKIVED